MDTDAIKDVVLLDRGKWLALISAMAALQGVERVGDDAPLQLKGTKEARGRYLFPPCVDEVAQEMVDYYLEPLCKTRFGTVLADEIGTGNFFPRLATRCSKSSWKKWSSHVSPQATDGTVDRDW